jgi:hypothetical protein
MPHEREVAAEPKTRFFSWSSPHFKRKGGGEKNEPEKSSRMGQFEDDIEHDPDKTAGQRIHKEIDCRVRRMRPQEDLTEEFL